MLNTSVQHSLVHMLYAKSWNSNIQVTLMVHITSVIE